METITIISAIGGMIITAMLMLRSDIKRNEQLIRSEVATLRGEIRQSEERTVEMIQQSEERTHRAIQVSEKRQDVLRKAELEPIKAHIEPIKEQVYNHIPTQINELRSIIVEYIVKGTSESKNITPPHHNDDEPATPH